MILLQKCDVCDTGDNFRIFITYNIFYKIRVLTMLKNYATLFKRKTSPTSPHRNFLLFWLEPTSFFPVCILLARVLTSFKRATSLKCRRTNRRHLGRVLGFAGFSIERLFFSKTGCRGFESFCSCKLKRLVFPGSNGESAFFGRKPDG